MAASLAIIKCTRQRPSPTLQADAGRIQDALATLEPQATRGFIRTTMVDYLIDLGRIEEAVTLRQLPDDPPATRER
jgi:hypothetical protein